MMAPRQLWYAHRVGSKYEGSPVSVSAATCLECLMTTDTCLAGAEWADARSQSWRSHRPRRHRHEVTHAPATTPLSTRISHSKGASSCRTNDEYCSSASWACWPSAVCLASTAGSFTVGSPRCHPAQTRNSTGKCRSDTSSWPQHPWRRPSQACGGCCDVADKCRFHHERCGMESVHLVGTAMSGIHSHKSTQRWRKQAKVHMTQDRAFGDRRTSFLQSALD